MIVFVKYIARPSLALMFIWHGTVWAEAFGNSALFIPRLGLALLDDVPLSKSHPWGIDRQYSLGASFAQALDYRWWWLVETDVGFMKPSSGEAGGIATFSGGAGLKFNIFLDDFRPHVGAMVHYLHFMGDGIKFMPLNLSWPMFVGIKPFLGLEWLFYSEMALLLSTSYGLYLNVNEPLRQVLLLNMAFAIYF